MAYKKTGKTTLVRKLLENRKENVVGFFSKKCSERIDEEGQCPIYIYGVNDLPVFDNDHLIGTCGNGKHYTNNEVFNDLGVKLITTDNPNNLIIMDELGFLESNAEEFKNKVIEVLSSPNPVLIMMKQRLDIQFLKELKDNQNIEFIHMNETNRDEVFQYLKNKLN